MKEYRVQLDAFEGPLDLLLYLIRRAEVDVTDVPIASIADQYLDYLNQIDRIDIDTAGEFLVMAATLMEIKSRMLMPPEERPGGERRSGEPESEGADPRAELIRQLLEYKRYRDAAEALESHRREWERRYPAAAARIGESQDETEGAGIDLDPEDIDLFDLVEAFSWIVETVNFDRLGEHTVVVDDTPIELHAEDILAHIREVASSRDDSDDEVAVEFASIFKGRSRPEMIGLFLAVLELVKQQRVVVFQEETSGRISLRLGPAADEPLVANAVEPSSEGASRSEPALD